MTPSEYKKRSDKLDRDSLELDRDVYRLEGFLAGLFVMGLCSGAMVWFVF